MAPGHQFFEHLAQHLGIDRDLDIQGGGLLDRKVVAVEQTLGIPIAEDAREDLIGEIGYLCIQRGLVE